MELGTISTLLGGFFGGGKPTIKAPTLGEGIKNPNEIEAASAENAQNKVPSWVNMAAGAIDYLNRQNAAREADLQEQRRASAAQGLNAINTLPGMSSMAAGDMARRRGLGAMAGR